MFSLFFYQITSCVGTSYFVGLSGQPAGDDTDIYISFWCSFCETNAASMPVAVRTRKTGFSQTNSTEPLRLTPNPPPVSALRQYLAEPNYHKSKRKLYHVFIVVKCFIQFNSEQV